MSWARLVCSGRHTRAPAEDGASLAPVAPRHCRFSPCTDLHRGARVRLGDSVEILRTMAIIEDLRAWGNNDCLGCPL